MILFLKQNPLGTGGTHARNMGKMLQSKMNTDMKVNGKKNTLNNGSRLNI